MRHLLANIATYTIASLLIVGAALFAWVRSARLTITDAETVLARFEPTPAHEFRWTDIGEGSYVRNCLNCHGTDGRGWDQYPGVRHTGEIFASPGGRAYLVDLHLYGLTSDRWRAPMPPMGHMHDVELAAVLNYVLSNFGNQHRFPPGSRLYVPAEVAARRDQRLSPREVDLQRPIADE
jgi:mono/diheme cytochrome c family protein